MPCYLEIRVTVAARVGTGSPAPWGGGFKSSTGQTVFFTFPFPLLLLGNVTVFFCRRLCLM